MAEAPDMNKILFANLVMMLSSSAMQQLGKLVNPLTNKTEVSLEGARMTIDMLEMLKAKTEGNLDAEEAKMMKEILSTLQINYVETSQNPPKSSEAEEKPESSEDKSEGKEDQKEEKSDKKKTKKDS